MKNYTIRRLVDLDTGEYLTSTEVAREFIRTNVSNHKIKAGILLKIRRQDDFSLHIKNSYGSFSFINYVDTLSEIPTAMLFRFTYLCSYLDYSGRMLWGNTKHYPYMRECDLTDALKLSRKEARETKEFLITKELILIDSDGYVVINNKYGFKGEIKNKYKGTAVRIFSNSMQSLYLDCIPREHKKAGLLFKMIPFTNNRYNTLVKNPREIAGGCLKALTPANVVEFIGYDKRNATRIIADICKLKVLKEAALKVCEHEFGTFITINPKLFYRHNSLEDIMCTQNLFKME